MRKIYKGILPICLVEKPITAKQSKLYSLCLLLRKYSYEGGTKEEQKRNEGETKEEQRRNEGGTKEERKGRRNRGGGMREQERRRRNEGGGGTNEAEE